MKVAQRKRVFQFIGAATLAGAVYLAWTFWPTHEPQIVLQIQKGDFSGDDVLAFDAKEAITSEAKTHEVWIVPSPRPSVKLPPGTSTKPFRTSQTDSYTLIGRTLPWGGKRALLTQKTGIGEIQIAGRELIWLEKEPPAGGAQDSFTALRTAVIAAGGGSKYPPYHQPYFPLDAAALRQPPQPGEKRREFALPVTASSGHVFVHRMSREGGPVTRITLDMQGLYPDDILWPQHSPFVYWRRHHPGKAVVFSQGDKVRIGLPPSGEIMRSPIDGSPAQSVATGLYDIDQVSLSDNHQVVTWIDYLNGKERWVFQRFAAHADARPFSLPLAEYRNSPNDFIVYTPAPVELGGYWYVLEKPKMDGEQSATLNPDMSQFWGQVVRFRAVGSERRVIVPVSGQDGVVRYPAGIIAGERQLYLLYKANRPEPKHWGDRAPDGLMHWYFAPLSPDKAKPIGEARELPLNAMPLTGVIDGDSFYFLEYHNGVGWQNQLMDIFSQSSLKTTENVTNLYRLRL